MIRVMLKNSADTTPGLQGGLELLEEFSPGNGQWLWLDLDNAGVAEEADLLLDRFKISELALTDARRDRHPPKFESFGNMDFLLLRGLDAKTTDINYRAINISFFIFEDMLITHHLERSLSIDKIWNEIAAETTLENSAIITFRVARAIADRYSPILVDLESRAEEIEDEMFENPGDQLLSELINYNRNLRRMRRNLINQRNALATLISTWKMAVDDPLQHMANDVREQFDRLANLATLNMELVSDLMNGYLSITSYRLNLIMKVLTVVTVTFLPLGLIAGIYGMNFEFMPELGWRFGYFAVLGLMAGIVVTLFVIMRRIRWL